MGQTTPTPLVRSLAEAGVDVPCSLQQAASLERLFLLKTPPPADVSDLCRECVEGRTDLFPVLRDRLARSVDNRAAIDRDCQRSLRLPQEDRPRYLAGSVSYNLERLDTGCDPYPPRALAVLTADHARAGSRYETPETNGIAHFAEHMFFKGTERRPTARDISMEIDAIGGEFNAFTGKEYTGYYVKCAAESRDVALDVLVDMLRHSKFDPPEIEREKGVIIEEMNMYFDTPRDYIGGVYHQLLFGDQPLGWDIIGRKETSATRHASVQRLCRSLVQPSGGRRGGKSRAIGDLHERVQSSRRHGGGGEGRPEPVEVIRTTRAPSGAHEELPTRRTSASAFTASARASDRDVLQVLATVLGGGMSSRLFTEVRERRGLAYYVYGLNHSYTDTGSLYAQAGVDINRIDDAVSTVAAELRKVAEEPVPAGELEKAKSFAKGRFVLQLETSQGLIMFGLRREVLESRTPAPEEILEAIGKVTADDAAASAQDDRAPGLNSR